MSVKSEPERGSSIQRKYKQLQWTMLPFVTSFDLFIKNKLTLGVISALCDIYDISGLVVILVPLKRHLAPHRINSEFHRNFIKKLTLINSVNISTISRQSLFQRYNLVKNDGKWALS